MTTDIDARPALTILSEEEEMFRDAIAGFAEEEVRPRVMDMENAAKLDPTLIPKYFDLGLMGIEVPEQYGGAGGSLFMVTLAVEEISKVDASAAILCDVQNTLVNYPINRYGSDAIRYYLMREMPFGSDGLFTYESLLGRINADLANDLGNLVSRTVAMIEKYFDGKIPACGSLEEIDIKLKELALSIPPVVEKQMDSLQFSTALSEIWRLVSECNRYIDQTQPWVLGRTEEGKPRLSTVLYTLAECTRFVAVLIGPAMPKTPARIFEQIGLGDASLMTWDALKIFGLLPAGLNVHKGEALFPRIDIAKELAEVKPASKSEQPAVKTEQPAPADNKKPEPQKTEEPAAKPGEITIEDFEKVQLRTARVIACERVPKSDKLLKLSLSLGTEQRTVVSGIAKHYTPEEMVGRQVVLVANLKPAKLRGI
jgi:methionyl-tRNA synthetase